MKKRCTICNKTWTSIREFIDDPDITLIGYQAGAKDINLGGLAFKHLCGHSFTIPIQVISYILNGPLYEEKETDSFECPGYCLSGKRFRPCLTNAECAYVRKMIQNIQCIKNHIHTKNQDRCKQTESS
jgi:hypothetical protein